MRADTGPPPLPEPVVEPTEPPNGFASQVSRVAPIDPRGIWVHSARSGCTVHALVALSSCVGMHATASGELGGVGGVGGVRQLSPGRNGPRRRSVQPASQSPNELAASWAPATADTALVSAETKPLTEKLLPSATGVVATSRRLAHSCAPAGVESVVNATRAERF